jgi:hypothetical protein
MRYLFVVLALLFGVSAISSAYAGPKEQGTANSGGQNKEKGEECGHKAPKC